MSDAKEQNTAASSSADAALRSLCHSASSSQSTSAGPWIGPGRTASWAQMNRQTFFRNILGAVEARERLAVRRLREAAPRGLEARGEGVVLGLTGGVRLVWCCRRGSGHQKGDAECA